MQLKDYLKNAPAVEIKDSIKDVLKRIKDEKDPDHLNELKGRFKDVLSHAGPMAIVLAESELMGEGYNQEDLVTVCDVHLEIFRESIENPSLSVPEGHPIGRFQNEHKGLLKIHDMLLSTARSLSGKAGYPEAASEVSFLQKLSDKLMEAENHNVRQENTLFPVLEKHGVDQPPAIMWTEHLDMKAMKKKFINLLKDREKYPWTEWTGLVSGLAFALFEKFAAHSQKEQNVLYAVAMEVVTPLEWSEIKEECDNLGYFELVV